MPRKAPIHQPFYAKPKPKLKPTYDRQATRYLHTGSAQWRAIRKAQLERFPLCQDCNGVAHEVDHNTGDTSQNRIGVDLSSLCKPCHSTRTARRQQGRKLTTKGCDINGMPLDPNHPWNLEKIAGG